ncbi:MAG: hypothetical protein MPF33_06105 [Candidatus Aramenus sp.]|jgi:hypothetical protein|nr:hypothetical protein [Candidatus Aramenus sp.]
MELVSAVPDEATLYELGSILLIEFVSSYYVLMKKFLPIREKYREIRKLLLLRVFRSLVEFLGSDDLLEESMVSSSLNISDEDFMDYFEGKLKSIRDGVSYLNKSMEVLEGFEVKFRRIQVYFDEVKYLIGIAFSLMVASLLLLLAGVGGTNAYYVPIVMVGISMGLEVLGLYYTILSIIAVTGLKKEIWQTAKLKAKSNTLLGLRS